MALDRFHLGGKIIGARVEHPDGHDGRDDPQDHKPQVTAGAHDPNDKQGPGGYGPEKYVTEDTVFPYTIRFENDAKASASCVLVTVSDPLPPLPLGFPGSDLGIHFGFEYARP